MGNALLGRKHQGDRFSVPGCLTRMPLTAHSRRCDSGQQTDRKSVFATEEDTYELRTQPVSQITY